MAEAAAQGAKGSVECLSVGIRRLALLMLMLTHGDAMTSELRFCIIQLDGAGHGMLISGQPLPQGAVVDIQYPGKQLRARCCKRLLTADLSDAPADLVQASDEVAGNPVFLHRVRVPKLWAELPFVGVAAIGKGIRSTNAGSALSVVNGQGRARQAGLCTSSEGVHLQEKQGAKLRTHLYLSLGYELEAPTCP